MKPTIKKILIISLSNIGDIILTFPVIDILKRDFPDAQMDLVIGPKGETLVRHNPVFGKIYSYDKNASLVKKLKWINELVKNHYDCVVDLRNTLIPFLTFARYKTPLRVMRPQGLHMREEHLARLNLIHHFTSSQANISALFYSEADQAHVRKLLNDSPTPQGFVIIAPGSRAENKRWPEDGFAQMADYVVKEFQLKIIFIGDENDRRIVAKIKTLMSASALDLAGQLTLAQSGYLLSLSKLAIVNDSAPLHLASYLNIPVAAFFGPTDPLKYGPWGQTQIVVQKNSNCLACGGNPNVLHDCMAAISFQDAKVALAPWLREVLSEK